MAPVPLLSVGTMCDQATVVAELKSKKELQGLSTCAAEPLRVPGVLSLRFLVPLLSHIFKSRRSSRDDAATGFSHVGLSMLNEQQTLKILGWTLSSVCLGTFLLSALALH
jgi:hypothetical protein